MANPKAVTNGTHELQERYSALVLAKLRQTSIFEALFNRRYEGDPTAGAVKIPVRDTEVAVGDYDIVAGGDLSTSTTRYLTLPIDKNKFVNELIDGFEAAAVPDNLVADRLDSAGYSMGKSLDDDLITLLTTAGNYTAATSTATDVYEMIVDEVQNLKKAHVAVSEMWLAVSNDFYGKLLKNEHFIQATAQGDNVIANGLVGKIAGVNVYETDSANMSEDFILGNNVFAHLVSEWMVPVAINDLSDGKHIGASAVQGRRVYGDMISRPTTIIVKPAGV